MKQYIVYVTAITYPKATQPSDAQSDTVQSNVDIRVPLSQTHCCAAMLFSSLPITPCSCVDDESVNRCSDAQLFACSRHLQRNELKRLDRRVFHHLRNLEHMYVLYRMSQKLLIVKKRRNYTMVILVNKG
jgi:hypothetical protein